MMIGGWTSTENGGEVKVLLHDITVNTPSEPVAVNLRLILPSLLGQYPTLPKTVRLAWQPCLQTPQA
jgi:hypothetical protein